MKNPYLPFALILLLSVTAIPAGAAEHTALRSPAPGILCDRYVCANDKGLSRDLTQRYLGAKAAAADVFTTSDVDLTEFTFANGVFCDTKERLCRMNRYFGADGKRSGPVSNRYTALLFGT